MIKPMHRLDRPSRFDEPGGEPVEQGRVCRPLAALAEVVGRANETLAEVVLPDPIDHDARGERVVGPRQPIRELAAGRFRGDPQRRFVLACKLAGTPRGTVFPSRFELPRRKTWASLNPSWRVPLGPPSCTTTARGMSRGGLLLEGVKLPAHAFQPRSIARRKHGAFARRRAARTDLGRRAIRRSSSVSGSIGRARWRGGVEPGRAQLGFDELALGFVELAVVNANLGELSLEARAAAGAGPTQSQGRDGRIGREGVDALPGHRRPVRCGGA